MDGPYMFPQESTIVYGLFMAIHVLHKSHHPGSQHYHAIGASSNDIARGDPQPTSRAYMWNSGVVMGARGL